MSGVVSGYGYGYVHRSIFIFMSSETLSQPYVSFMARYNEALGSISEKDQHMAVVAMGTLAVTMFEEGFSRTGDVAFLTQQYGMDGQPLYTDEEVISNAFIRCAIEKVTALSIEASALRSVLKGDLGETVHGEAIGHAVFLLYGLLFSTPLYQGGLARFITGSRVFEESSSPKVKALAGMLAALLREGEFVERFREVLDGSEREELDALAAKARKASSDPEEIE